MDDPLLVRGFEGLGNLAPDTQGVVDRKPLRARAGRLPAHG